MRLDTSIRQIEKVDNQFVIHLEKAKVSTPRLVIATGGLSFPTMGASPFGYQVAEQFGLKVLPVRAGLVPLTLHVQELSILKELSGVSLPVEVSCRGQSFKEAMLFTHRGLSGPSILQISSYWHPGDALNINLLPEIHSILDWLKEQRESRPKIELKTLLSEVLPARFAEVLCAHWVSNKTLAAYSNVDLNQIAQTLGCWVLKPNATEGYRTAEVTLGGVDTEEISSKTFESKKVPGLYFIGEVLDVTGHLGGFNFQWAWSSGYCCGLAL
ncbi:MAG: aminoacetone oxidase family FAD-binding enzyme [Gammaproteobacteria bacterium]|nr:aminoacetone oxidase family FAD-binding enzyme [Gammaproteobacteria bacterium]